jgi:protein transport protein SEC31
MFIKEIQRNSTCAWSPVSPLIAMGTVTGAMDASFSYTTELEIIDLNLQNGDALQYNTLATVSIEGGRYLIFMILDSVV